MINKVQVNFSIHIFLKQINVKECIEIIITLEEENKAHFHLCHTQTCLQATKNKTYKKKIKLC